MILTFISYIYSVLTRLSKTHQGRESWRFGNFIYPSWQTHAGDCREQQTSGLSRQEVWGMDTLILFSQVLGVINNRRSVQALHFSVGSWEMVTGNKVTGQKWQASARAAPSQWRHLKGEMLIPDYPPETTFSVRQIFECSRFPRLCQKSWFRGIDWKTWVAGENKNPKIYICLYLYIFIYLRGMYPQRRKEIPK